MFAKLIVLLGAPAVLAAQQTPADTTFHPIPIAEAVRLAKENNVANINATNSVRLANNNVRSARAEMYPTLTASAGQSKSAGDRLGQSGTLVPYASDWSYNTGLNSQITLFDAGKMFADVKTQQANVVSAQAAQVNTEFSIALQVKEAYNAILAAKESEAAAQAQLDAAQLQLEQSIARVKAGAANVSDSLRSVVQVGNAQLALLQAQNTYRTESATLTRLVGTNYFVTAEPGDTITKPLATLDSAQLMALALSGPQIRQDQAQINADNASIRAARTAYLPTVTANIGFAGNGTQALYGLNGNPFPYSRSFSLSINYPLFNRFSRENNLASAQISADNAQATLRDAQLGAQQNIITYIATLRNAEETMRVQQINVQASEEDLRVQQQRYALGASTLLDVLNSQSEVVTARQQLIQARLSYRNAIAQIESAIGRDLQ